MASPAISAKTNKRPYVHCNISVSCHARKSAPSSNVASAPARWRRNTSTATRHCFGPQGARRCDVPLQVDPRLDGFLVRSHGAGIIFLHDKLDRFREALWAEPTGYPEGAERHTE